jgi:hypothetical protein
MCGVDPLPEDEVVDNEDPFAYTSVLRRKLLLKLRKKRK